MESGSQGADTWQIAFGELAMEHEIGRGAYGRVYRARHLHTTVAAKQVSKDKKSSSDEFEREVAMLKRLRHPNIVLFMGVSETDSDFYIVQEFGEHKERKRKKKKKSHFFTRSFFFFFFSFSLLSFFLSVSGGGMNNLIRNQSIFWPWRTRIRMALEVGQALLYLHTKGVLHRDIVRDCFLFAAFGLVLRPFFSPLSSL